MSNLILVRHGESTWNLEKKFTGWVNVDLTDLGKFQAKESGKLIKDLGLNFQISFTSVQKRAIDTLTIILNLLQQTDHKTIKSWELNERHYGALTGLNKDQIKKIYGEKQVYLWRRSWDVAPPSIKNDTPNNPNKDKIYSHIDQNLMPKSESLKDTYNRVIPFWEKNILKNLKENKNIIISAHGNSLRALCKKIFNIDESNISKLEIPNGNPLHIIFSNKLKIEKYHYLNEDRSRKILANI